MCFMNFWITVIFSFLIKLKKLEYADYWVLFIPMLTFTSFMVVNFSSWVRVIHC